MDYEITGNYLVYTVPLPDQGLVARILRNPSFSMGVRHALTVGDGFILSAINGNAVKSVERWYADIFQAIQEYDAIFVSPSTGAIPRVEGMVICDPNFRENVGEVLDGHVRHEGDLSGMAAILRGSEGIGISPLVRAKREQRRAQFSIHN